MNLCVRENYPFKEIDINKITILNNTIFSALLLRPMATQSLLIDESTRENDISFCGCQTAKQKVRFKKEK